MTEYISHPRIRQWIVLNDKAVQILPRRKLRVLSPWSVNFDACKFWGATTPRARVFFTKVTRLEYILGHNVIRNKYCGHTRSCLVVVGVQVGCIRPIQSIKS